MADLSISKPDLKGLLSLEKRELARRVLELHDELVRERARRERVERDREMSHACETGDDDAYDRLMKEDRKAAHAEARAVIARKRALDAAPTADASLPACGSFHG
ncbi:hypothetical protein FV219_06595 [Methylobacterium sp. WL122]|nr:hypothetical protein FV219_06595 [Methylobacterium sp. WL122]